MADQSEAECLYHSGALYSRRLLLRPTHGDPVFAGFKPGAFSIYFGDEPIYHFDLEGRWQRAYIDGIHFMKGLDATVQAIDRVREGEHLVLKRKSLGYAAVSDVDARVRSMAIDLVTSISDHLVDPNDRLAKGAPLGLADLREFLERVTRWDAAAWFAQRERYLATYGPLPFIPPDCVNSIVVQATLGSEGRFDFGGWPGAEHYVRSSEEFAEHVREIGALQGRRAEQSRLVFLAGADAVRRPIGDIVAYLDTIGRVFPIAPDPGTRGSDPGGDATHRFDGVSAFLDRFEDPVRSRDEWGQLRALGLTRLCLGAESGAPEVRRLYGKDWDNHGLLSAVRELKAAELGISLCLLVGAGGVENEDLHTEASVDLVNSLDLGNGDIVFLLDAREVDCSHLLPFSSFSDAAFVAQRDAIRVRLAPVRESRKAKVVPYSLVKQGLT
jgi:hypothetical protein